MYTGRRNDYDLLKAFSTLMFTKALSQGSVKYGQTLILIFDGSRLPRYDSYVDIFFLFREHTASALNVQARFREPSVSIPPSFREFSECPQAFRVAEAFGNIHGRLGMS